MLKNKKAFTLVELLTVIAIIGLLAAITMPALGLAKKKARETACKSTIIAMEQSLEQFKTDQGFYPASSASLAGSAGTGEYDKNDVEGVAGAWNAGAHKLAEALIGYDMIGYEKNHDYWNRVGANYILTNATTRKSYMATDNLNITTLDVVATNKSITVPGTNNTWKNKNYVITDNLKADASLPFLYYKANTRAVLTYEFFKRSDNEGITSLLSGFTGDPDDVSNDTVTNFNFYVWDKRTGSGVFNNVASRPFKKDSFLIISAGFDQIYGTADDIANVDLMDGK